MSLLEMDYFVQGAVNRFHFNSLGFDHLFGNDVVFGDLLREVCWHVHVMAA